MKYCLLIFWITGVSQISAATYYVDFSAGSDSNDGTSKAAPWKLCPGMNGFSGSYTHIAGDSFIFKGGVTWPNSALSLYVRNSGTSASRDYYGVDQTWHAGVSWTRPVFDAGGIEITDPRSTKNNIIWIKGQYVTIDNIETNGQTITNGKIGYGGGIMLSNADHAVIKNCYVHDWVVKVPTDGAFGGIIDGESSEDDRAENCIVKGPSTIDPAYITDAKGRDSGEGVYLFSTVTGCDISKVQNGIHGPGIAQYNTIHDGGDSYDSAKHEDAIVMLGDCTANGNTIFNWTEGQTIAARPGQGGGPGVCKIYNNLIYNSGPAPVTISEEGNDATSQTEALVYNNILVKNGGTCVIDSLRTNRLKVVDVRNNLFITDSTPITLTGAYSTKIFSPNVTMSAATAAINKLTEANGYRMERALGALCRKGENLFSVFEVDKDRRARTQTGAWTIGAYEFEDTVAQPPATPQNPRMVPTP